MRHLRAPCVGVLAAAAFLCAAPARAQNAPGNTFNLQLFRPAIDSKGYFTVNASQVLGHLDFSIGLISTWAHDVLTLRSPSTKPGESLFSVSHFLTAQLQGALGLFKWGELGVSLPVHILFGSRGPAYIDASSSNRNSDLTFGAQMIGDIGLHPKVRLLNTSRHPVGLAVVTSLYLPTGDARKFLGEGNFSLRPELILDKELGRARRVRVALNAGALVRFDRNTFVDRGNAAPPTGGTGRSRALGTQLTYGLAIAGAVVPQKLDVIAELYGYADVTGADPDGRHGFPLEWLAGGKVYLAAKSYFEFGAGSGIIPDQTGSPAVRVFLGFSFEPSIGDRDGDGIKDDVDLCPDDPEDLDGFEDEDGCPDPDNDNDRILDIDDKCPNQPETYNGYKDDDGCPDEGPARVRHGVVETLGQIYFETARAVIRPISFPVLDAVAATVQGNPQIKLLEVQGHADERGDDDYNLRLTEARAQAVRQYLIDHGVAGERLQAHGYGEANPVCHEHADSCWTQNRRVEFVILRQEGTIPGQE